MNEKLNKIEKFFNNDVRIKELMNSVLDSYKYVQDKSMEAEIETKIFEVLKEIKFYLEDIINNFMPYERDRFNSFYSGIIDKFIHNTGRTEMLTKLFNNYVLDMREDFVKSVSESISGYAFFSGSEVIPITINEYLHYLHASIVNSEYLYSDMNVILSDTQEGKENYLYGRDSELIRDVFNRISSLGAIADRIDIINIQDRILLMARGLGHALMIEVHLEEYKAYVNYHIPKVCNYLKVNKLPGVTKVGKGERSTNGIFMVNISELPNALADFISCVPTDAEIEKFDWENYEAELLENEDNVGKRY